jgi:hypothetical protein
MIEVPAVDEPTRRISDQLVRLVQIFFAVVAGQSLLLYRDVVASPFRHTHVVAAIALLSVYVMIVWSWVDWNITMERNPYDTRSKTPRRFEHVERFRLYADLGIVTTYAFILFWVAPLDGRPGADIWPLLLGYVIVFGLYLASGVLRIVSYGRSASNIPPILWFGGAFGALLAAYMALRPCVSNFALNCAALVTTVVLMRAYRWYRRRYSDARKALS